MSTTRIVVDWDRCIGSGMCTSIAPELFELDDRGQLIVLQEAPAPEQLDAADAAVVCCPAAALALLKAADESA